jgi:hypothetical protein
MSRRLVFHPNVELELTEAVDWYETQRVGLGDEFLDEYDATLARVAEILFNTKSSTMTFVGRRCIASHMVSCTSLRTTNC